MKIAHSAFVSSQSNVQPTDFLPSYTSRQNMRRSFQMRIIPCSNVQMSVLAPRKVSAEQWGAYWGMTKMERLQKVLESLLVAYGGAWMAWFLSMLAGNVVSSFAGTALIFNWMYSPWLNAKKRNSKVWQSGNQKLSYALYAGRIIRFIIGLKRIKRRSGKTIGAVSQEYLVMIVQDEMQRELEIITQWQEPYRKLRLQMRCENMIASSTKDYSVLNMVTDSWIPACEVWVGDYPYLDRTAFRDFVKTIAPTKKESISKPFSPNDYSSVDKSERIGKMKDSTQGNDMDSDKEFNSTRFFDGSSSGKYERHGKNTDRKAVIEEIEEEIDFLDNENKEQFIREINKDGSKMKDGDIKRSNIERNNEPSRSQSSYDISSQINQSQQERRGRSKRK